jgi:hypothetical protein
MNVLPNMMARGEKEIKKNWAVKDRNRETGSTPQHCLSQTVN